MSNNNNRNGEKYLFDVYTARGYDNRAHQFTNDAVGITDGYCKEDISRSKGNDSMLQYLKNKRESFFPINTLVKAFNFDIRLAESSKPDDALHIRNAITNRAINITPVLDDHPNYDILNNTLRGKIMVPRFDQLIKFNNINDLLVVLKNSTETQLRLNELDSSQIPFNDDMANLLSDSIPITMKNIRISLIDCPIGPEGTASIFSIPSKLPNLSNISLEYAKHGKEAATVIAQSLSHHNNITY
eukprot:gene18400-25931_t